MLPPTIAETGKQAWRFYTVPGDPSKPFEHPEMEMAAKTWKGGEWWKIGSGGTVWNSIVYDPDFHTVYLGVGNGAPWTRAIRSPGGGDNLFLTAIVALDPDTGRMKWYYQITPLFGPADPGRRGMDSPVRDFPGFLRPRSGAGIRTSNVRGALRNSNHRS